MIYIYETLNGKQTFHISQGMMEPHLTHHPETGRRIRRVITGGCGFSKMKVRSLPKLHPNDYKDSKFNPLNKGKR